MPAHHHKDAETYRANLQQRTQDLLTGQTPRNPQLSSASTFRLLLEAVVEVSKIYRMQKEEEVAKERERRERRERRKHGHGHSHKHRERDRGAESGQSGERRHRHRNEEEGVKQRKSKHQHLDFNPLAEGLPDSNPEYNMTGAAGPAGTLPTAEQTSFGLPTYEHRHVHEAGQSGVSNSPTRKLGPDGRTAFGELPVKTAGVGIAKHFMDTYRHIKAEHEAGHRSRGALEKRVDELRMKSEETERAKKKTHKNRQRDMSYQIWLADGQKNETRGCRRRQRHRGKSGSPLLNDDICAPDSDQVQDRAIEPNVTEGQWQQQRVVDDPIVSSSLHPVTWESSNTPYAHPQVNEQAQQLTTPVIPGGEVEFQREAHNFTVNEDPPNHVIPPVAMPSERDFLPAFSLTSDETVSPSTSGPRTPEIPVLRNSPGRKPQVHPPAVLRKPVGSPPSTSQASKPSINIKKLERKPKVNITKLDTADRKEQIPAYKGTSHSREVEEKERKQVLQPAVKQAQMSKRQPHKNSELMEQVRRRWVDRFEANPPIEENDQSDVVSQARNNSVQKVAGSNVDDPSTVLASSENGKSLTQASDGGGPGWDWSSLGKQK